MPTAKEGSFLSKSAPITPPAITPAPADNVPDLADVDEVVKEHVQFVPVKRVDTVLEHALTYMPRPLPQEAPLLQAELGQTPATGYACEGNSQNRSVQ